MDNKVALCSAVQAGFRKQYFLKERQNPAGQVTGWSVVYQRLQMQNRQVVAQQEYQPHQIQVIRIDNSTTPPTTTAAQPLSNIVTGYQQVEPFFTRMRR